MPENFTFEEKKKFRSAYSNMIENRIVPAYQRLHDFMATEYLVAGRESSGFGAFPDGEAYYDYALRVYTTTNLNADSIHQLGLNEVARIRNEMEKIKNEVGEGN